jgi:oligopeptide/dipeptide ABC transporter ATP-binding protein
MTDTLIAAAGTGPAAPPRDEVLGIDGLTVEAHPAHGLGYSLIEDLHLRIGKGEIVGVVGESGSGKSMLAKSIMGLLPRQVGIASGDIRLTGRNLVGLNFQALTACRGRDMAMIFQDPMTSLNPVLRVGDQIAEAVRIHRRLSQREAMEQVRDLFRKVGIADPDAKLKSYPHEFSGGMRQRAMIAMAIANKPALLIADEPTTALDVTVQKQILRLILELSVESSTAVMFITHNMGVVASLCTRVAVMYSGRIVEQGPVESIFAAPRHPYTWSLLHSVPRLDRVSKDRLPAIDGQAPDAAHPPRGCRFQPRCPFAIARCAEEDPPDETVAAGHTVKCWVKVDSTGAPHVP